MISPHPFRVFGPSHLAVLAITAAITAGLVLLVAGPAALCWRHRLAYELAYFWGLSGTLQALVTPDLAEDFPSLHFITFQILHAGVVVAVLYLTLGLGMRSGPGSILRARLLLHSE